MGHGTLAAAAALAITAVAGASAASAKDGDVVAAGKCTKASVSKLKAGIRDGGIETSWEVDSNVNGQRWTWSLKDNGVLVASGSATTAAPSGSFTVRRVLANRAGSDTIVARAANAATGESCTATVTV